MDKNKAGFLQKIVRVKWLYRLAREAAMLLDVFERAAEFFEKIHRLLIEGIKTLLRVIPPLASIVVAVGYVSSIFKLTKPDHKNKLQIGANVIAGVALIALAAVCVALPQISLPLVVAASFIEVGLHVFKGYKVKQRVHNLKQQLATLHSEKERHLIEGEIQHLQLELKVHNEKLLEKSVELSYMTLMTALVVVGVAVPFTAVPTLAVVAVASVGYTLYRYRAPIVKFFKSAFSAMKRWFSVGRVKNAPSFENKPEPIMQDVLQEDDKSEATVQQSIEDKSVQQHTTDFLAEQVLTLEAAAVADHQHIVINDPQPPVMEKIDPLLTQQIQPKPEPQSQPKAQSQKVESFMQELVEQLTNKPVASERKLHDDEDETEGGDDEGGSGDATDAAENSANDNIEDAVAVGPEVEKCSVASP